MALTALEWLILPKEEQEKRKGEVSEHESFLLRTLYSEMHFSEEEKKNMSEGEKYAITHPQQFSPIKEEAGRKEWEVMHWVIDESVKIESNFSETVRYSKEMQERMDMLWKPFYSETDQLIEEYQKKGLFDDTYEIKLEALKRKHGKRVREVMGL